MNSTADKAASAVTNATEKVASTAHAVTDKALSGAQAAVDSTRKIANDSLDSIEKGMRSAQRQADPLIDDLAARAQEFACRSIEYCADQTLRARRQLEQATEVTNRYVAEQPGKSMLLAAAAGAAAATLIMLATRSSRH